VTRDGWVHCTAKTQQRLSAFDLATKVTK